MGSLRPPRDYSPTKHHSHPRASTGTMYTTSYDTLSAAQPGRSTVGNVSSHPSNVTYEAHPIRKTQYQDARKTEYAIKPRRNSTTNNENKKALAISTRPVSPPRRGTLVASPREIVSASTARDDSTRLLQPTPSLGSRNGQHYHQRHNSTSRADSDRYETVRDGRDRLYHVRGSQSHGSPKQYYTGRSHYSRPSNEEDWSWTGPREQFERDYPTRPRRDSYSRKERPLSVYDVDRPSALRNEYGSRPTPRPLDKSERGESGRHYQSSGFDSDPERGHDYTRRRQSTRAPVLHQRPQRDDGYSSAREDHESSSHARSRDSRRDDDGKRREKYRDYHRDGDKDRRRDQPRDRDGDYDRSKDYDRGDRGEGRRKPASRDPSPERSRFKDLAIGALGSLATTGTLTLLGRDAKEKEKDRDKDKDAGSDVEDKREHRRRRRRHRRDDEASDGSDGRSPTNTQESRTSRRPEDSSSETQEDSSHRRRHSRRRYNGDENDSEDRSDTQRPPRARSSSRVRPKKEDSVPGPDRQTRDSTLALTQEDAPKLLEGRTMSPGENEDDRPRRVHLVEPEKKEEVRPKGILKPARQVPFPEDPNPIREGVAPLKDATKDGIPPNARWTKINRVLVNPEALEKAHERFEEREDYVVVLRVLSKEEINKLAAKTHEIREARERGWQRALNEQGRYKSDDTKSEISDRDDDDEDRPQLLLEQAPSAIPVDFHSLGNTQSQQQAFPIRNMPGGYAPPGISVTQDHNQNHNQQYNQNYNQNQNQNQNYNQNYSHFV